jgi:DNA-binding LytR/AlgR family response regulator
MQGEEQKQKNNKINQLFGLLKGYSGLFLSVTFGIFLFILFFQPFPIDRLDFNDRLIFIAGLGAIIFFLMVLVRILFTTLFPTENTGNATPTWLVFFQGLSLFVLSSVAFAFYLRFVGKVYISFYIMVKASLICLVAPVVLRFYDYINELKYNNTLLIQEKKAVQNLIERYEDSTLNKTIEFASETGTEALKLGVADLVFIRSADNYVEIIYQEAEAFKKKLIRNTMKGIEKQVQELPNFARCHRTCIVNLHFVEKLEKYQDSYYITLNGYGERIPVSRQYLLKIKEML